MKRKKPLSLYVKLPKGTRLWVRGPGLTPSGDWTCGPATVLKDLGEQVRLKTDPVEAAARGMPSEPFVLFKSCIQSIVQ